MRLVVSAPTRSRVPTAAILAVALTMGTLLAGCAHAQRPPVPGAFVPPATPTALRLDVQQVRDGVLTVTGEDGTHDVAPPAGVPVYVLRSATPAEVRPGDWVVVAGVPNEVLNFAIRRITVIPAALGAQPDADGVPRLTGGLVGYEVGRDPHERPILSGRVTAVVGSRISVAVGGRTATLEVTDAALLHRVVPGTVADIGAGDRIAALAPYPGAPLTAVTALLVLPAAR